METALNSRNTIYKKICLVIVAIYVGVTIYTMITGAIDKDFFVLFFSACSVLVLFLPSLACRLFKLKPCYDLYMVYYLFFFFCLPFGNSLEAIAWLPGFDKILHFSSGFVGAVTALVAYRILRRKEPFSVKREFATMAWFSFCVNVTIAAVWELYEYAIFYFLHIDAINFATTGINDTMQDILVCLIGGIVLILLFARYCKKDKAEFFAHSFQNFCVVNDMPEDTRLSAPPREA